MKKRNQFFKRAGRVIAGINVLFNLGSASHPTALQAQAQTHELQSQWAKYQKSVVLPNWRERAKELGYQLREPVSGEYRPREGIGDGDQIAHQQTDSQARDPQEQMLSQGPPQGSSGRGRSRDGTQLAVRPTQSRQGRGDQGR